MNERIKELSIRAIGKRSVVMLEPEYIRFAELILKEFSKQVQIEGRFRLEREQTLIWLCCENAKKHFGVEE